MVTWFGVCGAGFRDSGLGFWVVSGLGFIIRFRVSNIGFRLTCVVFRVDDRVRVGRGAARAEDAQGTPTQSHMSPSILVYEDNF